ncbi:MAG: DUF4956 domain-containing protein [Proteobacteria bacterium]|nr:DUF4956 domain-containing protein [Pseudomonadota bacterium]
MTPQQLLLQLFDPSAQASQPLDAWRVSTALILTFLLSNLILQIYRYTQRKSFVARGFSNSIILTSLITTLIIMPISTNIVLSLGMVGALSIVRFRTALKDPLDIAFLFWAIAVGICNGAGFYNVSLVGTILIALLMLLQGGVGNSTNQQFLIVVRYTPSANDSLQRVLPPCQLLSQIVREEAIELTIEIEDPQIAHSLPQKLIAIEGVLEASVVNYNGEHLPS